MKKKKKKKKKLNITVEKIKVLYIEARTKSLNSHVAVQSV